jgi:hypothetical protein
MKPDELRRILEAAGRQEAPPRRPGRESPVTDPGFPPRTEDRRAWRGIRAAAAAAAVAVVVAGLLVLSTRGDDTTDVATEPATSTTVTTAVTLPPVTTASSIDLPTTLPASTVPETTTTTTTAPVEEALTITCTTTRDPQPAVTCEWSATTRTGLDHYRVWKHTGDGPDQEVYAGTGTRTVDTAVLVGARLFYEVTALAADGTVLGHGATPMVTCC